PFFISWELVGKYPKILQDEVVGEAATQLFADAQAMLRRLIDEKLLKAQAVIGFWPANRSGPDSVTIETEDGQVTLEHLRQQTERNRSGKTSSQSQCISLADYIAPVESGAQDYMGG